MADRTQLRVAVIGTGGTIASVGKGPLDLLDYSANETMLHVDDILARFPEVHEVADIVPVRYEALLSTSVFFPVHRCRHEPGQRGAHGSCESVARARRSGGDER
jgi:hypothetical protein